MRTTDRADVFNDTGANPDYLRTVVRCDAIIKNSIYRPQFAARTGKTYGANTTTVAMTARLPKMANDGAWVAFVDLWGIWGTNNLTIDGNTNSISSAGVTATTLVMSTNYGSVTLYWDRANRIWKAMPLAVPRMINRMTFFL